MAMTKECKDRIAAKLCALWRNPSFRQRMTRLRKTQCTPKVNAANSERVTKLWRNPFYRTKMLYLRRNSKKYTNRGKKISQGMKRSFAAGNYTIWNAGETKHTHPSVMKISRSLQGRIPDYNKYRAWYDGPNGHIRMRSSWEVDFAEFCDKFKIEWQYEPKHFHIGDGEWVGTTYTPDFYLPKSKLYVEIKGSATEEFWRKLVEFHKRYPQRRIVMFEKDKMDVVREAMAA